MDSKLRSRTIETMHFQLYFAVWFTTISKTLFFNYQKFYNFPPSIRYFQRILLTGLLNSKVGGNELNCFCSPDFKKQAKDQNMVKI